MSIKCRECGLVNLDYEEICKRCNASLSAETPSVYRWYIVYCILMAFIYLVTAIMGVVFLVTKPDPDMSDAETKIMGSLFLILGLVLFVFFAVAPFLPRKSWVWTYGLVLICLGLTSACCLPACIPLLIFWLKPELKAFFGRTPIPMPPLPPQWS